jgi:hypothetical protein
MNEQQIMDRVGDEIITRSEQCERGVLAISPDGQMGIALVAPNSLMLAWLIAPDVPPFDFWLN